MAGPSARRPIPALVFLLALSLLSGLVWYRVLNRDDAAGRTTGGGTSASRVCVPRTAKPVALPKPSGVTVSVLNAAGVAGLARSVGNGLKGRGFKLGAIGNDSVSGTVATEVRYGIKSASAARLVQLYVPGSRLVPVQSNSSVVVVAIGTSYKSLATNAQVTKARATAGPIARC
ncbi:MAG: LytR C-terminal domain-containing protein [bacterium]